VAPHKYLGGAGKKRISSLKIFSPEKKNGLKISPAKREPPKVIVAPKPPQYVRKLVKNALGSRREQIL